MTTQLQTRPVSQASSVQHAEFTKEICLTQEEARLWIGCIESLGCDQPDSALFEFSESLGDAIWLAEWKREYVRLDIDVTDIPVLLSFLVSQHSDETDNRSCDILEEMLSKLSEFC